MAKSRTLEAQLDKLNALRSAPITPQSVDALRKALSSKNPHIVTMASDIIADAELSALEPDLVQAFGVFMRNLGKSDPGCQAKIAIVNALMLLESVAEETFLRGLYHVQMEPTWGGEVDTAAPLRGACAMALVRMQYRDIMVELARLLADPEADARIAATRALAYTGDPAAVPLLHFKAHIGDKHPQVMSECLGALLKLEAESALPFVAEYLKDEDYAIAEAAALALGESRLAGALDVLQQAWEETFDAQLRSTLLIAIAMLRQEEAIQYLLDMVRNEARVHAEAALAALQMYRRDEAIWQRVQQARCGANES